MRANANAAITAAAGGLALLLAGLLLDLDALALARLALCGAALGGAVALDLRERRIPNRLVLPAAAGCLALSIGNSVRPVELASALPIVAVLGAISLARPQALGMGDVKLALLIAVGLDSAAARALLLGLALAAAVGLALLVREGRAAGQRALPLAPFLAAGSLLGLLL